jgi:threonine dehydrogenase-like Zn-dependent dehydrogenase
LRNTQTFKRRTTSKLSKHLKNNIMKALVYYGRDVRVAEMPDAIIEQPTDVLVKITATNICGSDLHMYQGRTDMEKGF